MLGLRSSLAGASLIAGLALLATAPAPAAAAACPNQAIREAQGTAALALPDCRAYELASPGSTPYVGTTGNPLAARASTRGSAIAYFAYYPAEGAQQSGFYYLASRGSGGWSVEALAPQDSPGAAGWFACVQSVDPSPDLSRYVLSDGWNVEELHPGEPDCQESEEPLVAGAPRGYGNLFLRDTAGGAYTLLNITPEGSTPVNARFKDATPDFSHVLFRADGPLTPEAPAGEDLYEWVAGADRLVGFLPDGEPAPAALADGGGPGNSLYQVHALAPVTHALSADGERVFFYAGGEFKGGTYVGGGLYLRENATQPPSPIEESEPGRFVCTEAAKACTVQIDEAQGGAGESGGGVFWDASEDGSRVFFADESKLTPNSNASPTLKASDLYEYDLAKPPGERLTDLTPGSSTERAVARGFVGASEDGSHLYFVARGALTGTEENDQGAKAVPHQPNLYLEHEGTLSFIATLDPARDYEDWQEDVNGHTNEGNLTARVSPNGRYLAFGSTASLTGFDNVSAEPGECAGASCQEVYLYDAAAKRLACASCAPSGARPTADTVLPLPYTFSFKGFATPAYLSRNVLDDGRLFFTSPDALLPADQNGAQDVYEYTEGKLQLISSAAAAAGSAFYDASPDGTDLFFVTDQNLVRTDADNHLSLYDARAGGGFPEPPPPPACEAEASCLGAASQPPPAQTPATHGFEGLPEGPAHPRCAKGFVRRPGHCVKPRHRHKHRAHHRHARANRGVGK